MEKTSQMAAVEVNLKTMTKLVKPLLGLTGAWPLPHTSSFCSRLLRKIEHILTFLLFFMMIIPSALYVIFKETNNDVKFKQIGLILNWIMQLSKYTTLLLRMKEIEIGLEMIRQDCIDATNEHRAIFQSNAKIAQRMVLIIAFTMYSGGIGYRIILPLLRGTIVTPDNVTIRPLPSPSYFVFFTPYATPNYQIIFTMQVLAGGVTYAIISGSCGICALMVLHMCSMLRILINKINDLTDNENMSEPAVRHRIRDIVRYQVKIKRFLNNISGVTDYICLIEMSGGTFLICLGLNSIVTDWENGNTLAAVVFMTLISSSTTSIFVMCYIGQLLADENTDVEVTSCTVNWYRLPTRHARDLIPIIAMSFYPMKITACRMLDMSLGSFTDVMKVSVGYFNILHNSA